MMKIWKRYSNNGSPFLNKKVDDLIIRSIVESFTFPSRRSLSLGQGSDFFVYAADLLSIM